ncbi:MAG TPA: cytochrome c [Terriglobia bacterium]|nr:cytochrome c [Terriglobia bacterium]
MRKLGLLIVAFLATAGFAAAQVTSPTQDVLGAHNVYGRGCIACHAPHSGAAGNGGSSSANTGNLALWGENLSPLYGQTLVFGNSGRGTSPVTIPNYGTTAITVGTNTIQPTNLSSGVSAGDGTFVIAACLSCHDGNLAVVGMLRGTTYETVTINGAVFNPPTLLGNDGSTPGNYLNDHPVGPEAVVSCGGKYNWDCTVNADGSISYNGPGSSAFLTDYFDVTKYGPIADLVKVPGTAGTTAGTYTSNSWVTCTTCHDQHDMLYFNAGPSVGIKPTHFFVRGWYNPGNTTTSNSAAQFCRTCHGGESNEMHNQIVPTT